MPSMVEVAIIGAGPYGLSLAAHLRDAGVSFRIFGKPMSTWRDHMPLGMYLKSEGFASNLSAPDANSTLEAWCAANARPYTAQKTPVALADFVAYADWFAAAQVPMLERFNVIHVLKGDKGYALTLETGAVVHARRVVLAVGISWFKHTPAELAQLPAGLVSHSFDHHRADEYRGREVVVLGAGSSAVDTALAFAAAGARTTLVARSREIRFHVAPGDGAPTILGQLQYPDTGIGPGWRSF
ncbi:MAG TPA: NAD(P)-binding domain-containing protein, partial [Rhizomicrobium sp.]